MTHPIDTTPEAIAALLDGVTPGPWRIQDCASMGHRCTNYYQEIWNDETDILVTTEVTRAHNDGGAKNMRFIAAARELVPALAAEIARLTAERDEARAQVAMAYEVAGKISEDNAQDILDNCAPASAVNALKWVAKAIRALTPAEASTALAARDAAMRNEGRRQAAALVPSGWMGNPHVSNMDYGPNVAAAALAAILATLEPEIWE